MDIKVWSVVKVSVVDSENYNGKWGYRISYKGRYYRVKRYPGQPLDKKEMYCTCVGLDSGGRPMFEQSYTEVFQDLYKAGEVYPFKLTGESKDTKPGSFYYQLEDENGFRHRVYTKKASFSIGQTVQAKVLAVNTGYLSLELLPKDSLRVSSSASGKEPDQKKTPGPVSLDFSKLNPAKDVTLRDYQVDNKRKIYEAWQSCRSVMLQMPTGTGKTRLFVSIARDIFDYGASNKKTFKVLILAHRKELIEQISDHLGQKYRLAHGLIISQNIEQKKYSMQVGSVPTLNRRLERWEDKNFDVIIIDEAHHVKAKSYKKIIDLFPNAKILGVTATPYRLNHAGFRPEFDELIVSPSVAEFIKRGYLCEYDYYSIRPNSELQKEIDRMKLDFEGDYKESEMMGVMDRDAIRADILDTYQRYAGGKKAIVYTISRDHNVHLAKKFKDAGIISAAIDSETPKEKRDELVNKFRRGDIQVLFNVNIFSEGFDCPDVEVIQLARPTKSLSMYLQQVGRGLRPAEGKERLLVLDNVGLYNKFGFPSAHRKWKYHFEGQDVDETPAAHLVDHEEQREVKDIVEGSEEVAMLHTSTEEEVATTAMDFISMNYKDGFIEFACQKIDDHTVKGYVRNIERTLDAFIGKWIKPGFKSLFNTVDLEEIEEIRTKLFKSVRFKKFNDEKHHVFSAAFNKYIAFAKWFNEHIPDEPSLPDILPGANTPDTPVDYRPRFKAFLKKDRYSDSGAEQVIKMLKSKVDYYIKTISNPGHKSIFETSDVELLTKYYNNLMQNLTFANYNKMKASRPGSALKKYIEFAKSLEEPETPTVPEDPTLFVDSPSTPVPQTTDRILPHDGDAASVEEIDASLKELDSLVALLKKNNLPINPDIEERQRRLHAQKAKILQQERIVHPLEARLKDEGLFNILSFEYSSVTGKVTILSPSIDTSIQQNLDELEQIISLMSKNSLSIPRDVHVRQASLSLQKARNERILAFGDKVIALVATLHQGGIDVESIHYSPDLGFKVKFSGGESVDLPGESQSEPKPFVLDKSPMPNASTKALLRVTLEDGSVMQNENASDTFLAVIEHIGISKVKQLGIKMYYRQIIAATPHHRYKGQCKKLSNGEYLLVLSTTERKAQIINSIAKYYGLSIKAELIDKKKI